jgi:aldehyde:ferredoxin oxidoreductase
MNIISSIHYTPAEIKGGCTDRVLLVDLESNDITILELEPDFKDKYIGGRGYALKLIWDYTDKDTRFDSSENLLVMAGGPLCNEPRFPGSGKFVVGTISPLTDTFIDSNVGGFFAPILKSCGFDAIAVKGISAKRVVVIVDEDKEKIAIAHAPDFSSEVENGGVAYGEALMRKFSGGDLHRNFAVVTTGAGAENTRFGIINSHFYDSQRKRIRTKQAGRGGTGTVMRHKNLMGIIVHADNARSKSNNADNYERVKKAGSALARVIKQEDPKQLNLQSWGTPVLVEYMNRYHLLPVNNYQKGQDEKAKTVFSEIFLEKYLDKNKNDGCYYGCNLACAKGAKEVTLTRGPQAGKVVDIDGPEYETVGAITCLGIFDPQFIMEFNWYCDEYGLDTISMGVSSAFLFECFQRGYLTLEDTGYELNWGDIDAADMMLHETASGTGIGKICGEGVKRAKEWVAELYCNRTGRELDDVLDEIGRFAMELKGLEFSMYISRESLAQQGGYGFALKGPQHDEAWLIFLDQVHKEIESYDMKTAALIWFPLIRTWFNAVGLCKLPWIDVRHPEAAKTENPAQNMPTFELYIQYLNSTTGSNKKVEDILYDSERLHLLQKLINLRQGKGTREFDQVPLRAMAPVFIEEYGAREEYYNNWIGEHSEEGKIPAESLEERHELLIKMRQEAYSRLCDTVYRAKGYNSNSVPLPETVEKFGLLDEKAEALLSEYIKEEIPV